MITGVDALHAEDLREKGWTISAIARHLGHDRKTVRAYLNGERTPGARRALAVPDEVARFVPYLRSRLAEDPHVWVTALYDEIVELGFEGGYSTLTRRILELELRPHCEPCSGVKGRVTVEIEHPPREEIQWDWVDLPEAPWGGTAQMLIGSLPFSGRFRGVLADSKDQPHLIAARWWRTMTAATIGEAQAGFDRWCARISDKRRRPLSKIPDDMAGLIEIAGRRPLVFELALLEGLRPLAAVPFPATVSAEAKVGPSATARFEGNAYGVPVALRGHAVVVSHRLGTDTVEVRSPGGIVVATHHRAPRGAGMIVRSPEQQASLERTVLDAFSTDRPCTTKGNRPPGQTSRAEAARLRGEPADAVVVDLATYQAIIDSSKATR